MSLQLAVAVAGTSGEVLPGHLKKGADRQVGAHSLSPAPGLHSDLMGNTNRSSKDAAFCLSRSNFLLFVQ